MHGARSARARRAGRGRARATSRALANFSIVPFRRLPAPRGHHDAGTLGLAASPRDTGALGMAASGMVRPLARGLLCTTSHSRAAQLLLYNYD